MQGIKGALRNRLRERPFDFYAAFAIFIAGAYALLSPSWPSPASSPQIDIMVNLVSCYLMVASAFVISALLCNKQKRPAYAIFAEMWGWLAISAASFAVSLMYIARTLYFGSDNLMMSVVLIFIWFGMCLASGFRSLDIYLILRGVK